MDIFTPHYSNLLLAQSLFVVFFLRMALAAVFLAHGMPKLRNLKNTWQMFEGMGFRPGRVWGTLVAILEGVGGTFLLLGILTQYIALLLAIQMAVAFFWRIKKRHAFINGYELDLVLIAGLLVLVTQGSGAFALGILWGLF